MLRAYFIGFWEHLLLARGARRSWQPSFELNLAYERGATLAEALAFWRRRQNQRRGPAPSRFKWWLQARARQRASLRAANWGARIPAARIRPEFGLARRHLQLWGDSQFH